MLTYEDAKRSFRGGPGAYSNPHTHAMSLLAEQKVAQMLGLEWELHGEDAGYDLRMGDITIDVKWTDKTDRNLITHLPVKAEKNLCDIYILVHGKDPDKLKVLGFISGRKATRYPTITETEGHRTGEKTYWVPETALTPLVDIFDRLQAAWPDRFGAYIEQTYPRSAWEVE